MPYLRKAFIFNHKHKIKKTGKVEISSAAHNVIACEIYCLNYLVYELLLSI